MSQWHSDVHARVAAAIKRCRDSLGWSAQDLADRTEVLGYPLSRARIANYESGRKKNLDIAELMIIAAALDVPAVLLLYPDVPDGPVELLPGIQVDSYFAYRWATAVGNAVLAFPDGQIVGVTPESGAKRLLEAADRRSEIQADLLRIMALQAFSEIKNREMFGIADHPLVGADAATIDREMAQGKAKLAAVVNEIRGLGGTVIEEPPPDA